jgi:hypothetical protein
MLYFAECMGGLFQSKIHSFTLPLLSVGFYEYYFFLGCVAGFLNFHLMGVGASSPDRSATKQLGGRMP